jgi:hypothetical protein
MDTELLRKLGEALGIGGLALGVFFLLFRELIRRTTNDQRVPSPSPCRGSTLC